LPDPTFELETKLQSLKEMLDIEDLFAACPFKFFGVTVE
jgi:hypothetical protein